MPRTRLAVAGFLSVVLGLLLGLGAGALAFGDSTGASKPAARPTPASTGAPVLRITRHVDAGTYVWVLDAVSSTATPRGTDVTLHLTGVRPTVRGISNRPGSQAVSVSLQRFFGSGADAYDFALPDTLAAVVRTTGDKGRQPVVTPVLSAQLHGDEVDLTLRALSGDSALAITANTSEPISIVIDGGPLGLRH